MCPKYIQSFVSISKIIITLIKVAVPILLIVFGSIDMFKAVTQQNEDKIKKATKKFIERLIAAAIVFFVFPIIMFIANIVAPNSKYVTDFTYCYEHETTWNMKENGDTVIEKPSNQIEGDEINESLTSEANIISSEIKYGTFTGTEESINYVIYIPTFDKDVTDLTLIVYLHGKSGNGTISLDELKSSPPFGNMGEHKAIILAPQCKWDSWGNKSVKKIVLELTDYIKNTYNVNSKKISLIGFSAGALGAYWYARTKPTYFSSLVVISYKPPSTSIAYKYTLFPLRGYYGSNEIIENINATKKLFKAINAVGGNATFEIIKGKSHGDMDDYVFYETDTIEWMIKQTNKN